jgi:Zinc knuckle
VAFTASQSLEKGKKGGKKSKKGIKCYNCHKKGHIAKDCWASGGGAEGKRLKEEEKGKGKGKKKEVAAKVDKQESHRDDDSDAMWMASAGDGDDVTQWLINCRGADGAAGYELWTEDKIAADESDEQVLTESEHSDLDVSLLY